jgi:hypothetical protein
VRAAGDALNARVGTGHGRQQHPRDDRGGVPSLRQQDLEQQVRARVADVGLEPRLPAGVARPRAGGGLRRVENPWHARQVRQPERPVVGDVNRVRTVRRQDQEQLVSRQQLGAGAGHRREGDAGVLLPEDEVELVREQAVEGRYRLLVGDLEPQPGVPFRQPGQHRRDQREQHRLERGDPQRAADLGRRRPQLRLRFLEPLQDRLGVGDQQARQRGEPDAAPYRLEQGDPGLGLQLAELLGDRGRAVGQRPGHGGEGAAPVELAQQPQAVHVEHRASIASSRD